MAESRRKPTGEPGKAPKSPTPRPARAPAPKPTPIQLEEERGPETIPDLEPTPTRPDHRDPGVKLLDVHGLADGADPSTVPAAWWPLADLTPWDLNPRNHPARQVKGLAELIKRHGFTTVMTAHWPTRRIVKGHGRRLSMLALLKADPEFQIPGSPGPGYVPVRFKGGTWEDAVRDLVADNRIQEEATWRTADLGDIMAGWAAEGDTAARIAAETGFSAVEVTELVKRSEGRPDPRTVAPPACPPPPRKADSRPGVVYQLGPHRLVCGDCTDPKMLAAAFGGDAATGLEELGDMVFTDPPFAIYGSSTGLGADMADDKLIRPFFRSILDTVRRVSRPWAHSYVCCDWRSWSAWWDSAGLVKLSPKNKLIWFKGGGGLGSMYANSYEEIGFFANVPERTRMFTAPSGGARMVMRSNVLEGFPATDGDDGPERGPLLEESADGVDVGDGRKLILRYNRVTGADRVHNAAKPIGMIEELIGLSSEPEQLVVDLFGGGGTALLASARTGRRAALFELSPAWCDVIRHRWTAWAREAMVDAGTGALVLDGGPALLGA